MSGMTGRPSLSAIRRAFAARHGSKLSRKVRRAIQHAINPGDGAPIVRVPVAGAPGAAVMDLDAWQAWTAAGLPLAWFVTYAANVRRAYVRCACPAHLRDAGNLMTPARFVAGAGPRQNVRYRDGNPFNLRRSNLCLITGQGRSMEAKAARVPVPELA